MDARFRKRGGITRRDTALSAAVTDGCLCLLAPFDNAITGTVTAYLHYASITGDNGDNGDSYPLPGRNPDHFPDSIVKVPGSEVVSPKSFDTLQVYSPSC